MEKLHGDTPDISMFRFKFWQPIWYYEPIARFPQPNFLPGRFVGIAWDHGDAFTYRIWTMPDNNFEKGQELIRNVVQPRIVTDTEPMRDYKDDCITFDSSYDSPS